MKNLSWDDLHIFVHVARGGGLSPAAAALGSSPATVGRRMLALEQALGRGLFLRSQSGYALTADGEALYRRAQAMEAQARPIADWAAAEGVLPVVRLSTGTWTANFIAENFTAVWTPADRFRIALTTTEARLDIAHREIDLGIRNAEPTEQSLASRRMNRLAFAPFRARSAPPQARDAWVSIRPEQTVTRTARWINAHHGQDVVAWANTPRTLVDLIHGGVGTSVLPCFAGDRDPALVRAGPPVAALEEHQWLVMHQDDRHRPEIRTVIDRVVTLMGNHAPLFAGERPIGATE